MTKPAIPQAPKPNDPRERFDTSVKETLEIITGRRGTPIKTVVPVTERWRSVEVDIIAKTAGGGTPVFSVFNTDQMAYLFVANDIVYSSITIPRDWKAGTNLLLYVNWAGSNNDTGNAVWNFLWQYARGYGLAAFSASATVSVTQSNPATAFTRNIAEFSSLQSILPTNCEPDGLLLVACRLASQTYTGTVFGFSIGMHYQSDMQLPTTQGLILANGSYFFDKTPSIPAGAVANKFNEIIGVMQ